MDKNEQTSTCLCSNCGTAIYYRRRFGGTTWVWVHGGAAIDAPAVQQCPAATPKAKAA